MLAGLDAAMARVDFLMTIKALDFRVIEKIDDIAIQRALVPLESQGVVTALFDDLPGDLALGVEGIDRDDGASLAATQPFSESSSKSLGTAVISLDFSSTAICASTKPWARPQAETMCSGDCPLALSKEPRSTLPSIATTPLCPALAIALKRAMKL